MMFSFPVPVYVTVDYVCSCVYSYVCTVTYVGHTIKLIQSSSSYVSTKLLEYISDILKQMWPCSLCLHTY